VPDWNTTCIHWHCSQAAEVRPNYLLKGYISGRAGRPENKSPQVVSGLQAILPSQNAESVQILSSPEYYTTTMLLSSVLVFVVLSCFTYQAARAGPVVAPGQTCKCKSVPNDRRCFYLDQPSTPVDQIITGKNGLLCTQKACGPRYECCDTGTLHCLVKRVPYTLTCTGYIRRHEVCKLTRPSETYLVPYTAGSK
jgi:hypothetical protein